MLSSHSINKYSDEQMHELNPFPDKRPFIHDILNSSAECCSTKENIDRRHRILQDFVLYKT